MNRVAVGSILVICCISPVAATPLAGWKLSPYIGVDAQVRRMDFKGGYGNNLLRHHSPQGNAYAGLKLNEWLGLEVGFESTITRSRLSTLTNGDLAAGTPIEALMSPSVFRSKMKIKGPHVEVVGFYSFYEGSPCQLLASVGASFLKGTIERQTLSSFNIPRSTVRTLSARKRILRLGAGLQYMLGKHLGARVTVGWENTSKMVIYSNDQRPCRFLPEIKPKNTAVGGLGLLWAF